MESTTEVPATVTASTPRHLILSGRWTASGIGALPPQLLAVQPAPGTSVTVDGAQVEALDTAGAWTLQQWLLRLRRDGVPVAIVGLRAEPARLLEAIARHVRDPAATATLLVRPEASNALDQIGRHTVGATGQAVALLAFVGESALALATCLAHPKRLRWRPILFNIRSAGFDALPIVGLLSFLLGVVVAYQAADQLRRYGANIFVADLVGLSMLREFAPLMTAIIIAGRSGSAYAAQIGTMAVTVNDNDSPGQLVITPATTSLAEGGGTTYTVQLSAAPTAQVTVTVITEKHVVPHSAHTIQYGYFANAVSLTAGNLQKDNMLFDWTELTNLYTAAYNADRGVAPETTTTAPNGHLAGTKAVIDKLDLLWGGGRYKAKWPDGASSTDNPRLAIIEGIHNCYSLTRLSTDTTNFPIEVRERCRFAAHLMAVSPTATTSH